VWVLLALGAGCLQTVRNALAKSLSGQISPALNSWSRFAFNLPFSLLLVLVLDLQGGWPALPPAFLAGCLATAVCQLLGNVALVSAFRRSNFAESIVFHKLEVVFTAIFGVLFFSEAPSAAGWVGIFICGLGVLAINLGRSGSVDGWRRAFHFDTGAWLALTCAVLLVFASFALKAANESFALANPQVGEGRFVAAAHTLFHTTWIEVALLTAWLLAREPEQFAHVRVHWKRMLGIGATGFLGSLGWFWAYSLTLVAYVKTVGQIEAVLAVVLALVVWREREVWRQIPGVALIGVGIAVLLLL